MTRETTFGDAPGDPAVTLDPPYVWRSGPTDSNERFKPVLYRHPNGSTDQVPPEIWAKVVAPMPDGSPQDARLGKYNAWVTENQRAVETSNQLWKAGKIPATTATEALQLYIAAKGPGYLLWYPAVSLAALAWADFIYAKHVYHDKNGGFQKVLCYASSALQTAVPIVLNFAGPQAQAALQAFTAYVNSVDPQALQRGMEPLTCAPTWQSIVDATNLDLIRLGFSDLNQALGVLVATGVLTDHVGHVIPGPAPTLPPWAAAIRYPTYSVSKLNIPAGMFMSKAGVPASSPAPKYRVGSISRFNKSRHVWSVYSPLQGVLFPEKRNLMLTFGRPSQGPATTTTDPTGAPMPGSMPGVPGSGPRGPLPLPAPGGRPFNPRPMPPRGAGPKTTTGKPSNGLTVIPMTTLPTDNIHQSAVIDVPAHAGTPASRYPAGSFMRFNKTRGTWSVYSPLAGFAGLGDAEVTPPVPSGFVKVAEELTPPADVPQAGQEEDAVSLFKKPAFWAAVGVAVVGTGVVVAVRRRRRAA